MFQLDGFLCIPVSNVSMKIGREFQRIFTELVIKSVHRLSDHISVKKTREIIWILKTDWYSTSSF